MVNKTWLTRAENHFASANVLYEHAPTMLDIISFQCHQSVEKHLRALGYNFGQDFEKNADLKFLLDKCTQLDPDFKNINLKSLNEISSDILYPNQKIFPTLNEVKEYLHLAEQIRDLVKSKIKFD